MQIQIRLPLERFWLVRHHSTNVVINVEGVETTGTSFFSIYTSKRMLLTSMKRTESAVWKVPFKIYYTDLKNSSTVDMTSSIVEESVLHEPTDEEWLVEDQGMPIFEMGKRDD